MESINHELLASEGGTPLRDISKNPWPSWPQYTETSLSNLSKVLSSGRWTVSGPWTGKKTYETLCSEKIADVMGSRYCTMVDHGASALFIALQALGVREGDEVIVPGLTWIACASVVLRLGAKPVFVDIEESCLGLDPIDLERKISTKTKVIMVVHLYSCMADMEAIMEISKKYSIPVLEDCSHAHKAMWKDKFAGTIGQIGIFSLHQGKPLTCGEGGFIICSDPILNEKFQRLRSNGRRYSQSAVIGRDHLDAKIDIRSGNYNFSEFHAAVLLDTLPLLDKQNLIKQENASYLDHLLSKVPGTIPMVPHKKNISRTYYHYVTRLELSYFGNHSIDEIAEALSHELGLWVHKIYAPLDQHLEEMNSAELPRCYSEYARSIAIHHSALLSPKEDMVTISKAFSKVQRAFSREI